MIDIGPSLKYVFAMGKGNSKRRGGKILLKSKYEKSETLHEVF